MFMWFTQTPKHAILEVFSNCGVIKKKIRLVHQHIDGSKVLPFFSLLQLSSFKQSLLRPLSATDLSVPSSAVNYGHMDCAITALLIKLLKIVHKYCSFNKLVTKLTDLDSSCSFYLPFDLFNLFQVHFVVILYEIHVLLSLVAYLHCLYF